MRYKDTGGLIATSLGNAVDVSNGVAVVHPTAIDGTDATVTHAVIGSVASVSGTDPLELPPLYDVIDPDALNSLCSGRERDGADSVITVSFEYAGHHVDVSEGGTATATPLK